MCYSVICARAPLCNYLRGNFKRTQLRRVLARTLHWVRAAGGGRATVPWVCSPEEKYVVLRRPPPSSSVPRVTTEVVACGTVSTSQGWGGSGGRGRVLELLREREERGKLYKVQADIM